MKITMPSLKVDMVLSEIRLREGRPIIICRMGVYEATTELSREDIIAFARSLLKPRNLWAFVRLVFSSQKQG